MNSPLLIFAAVWLAVLMLFASWRLFTGPTVPDRVVGLDAINTLVVACMIVLGVAFREIIFIDVAIVYGLLSFVGVLFIAKFLGKEI